MFFGDKRAPRVKVVSDMMQRGVVFSFPRGVAGQKGEVGALQAATFRRAFINATEGPTKEFRLEAEVTTPDGRVINRVLDCFLDHDDGLEALRTINAAMSRRSSRPLGAFALAAGALVIGVAIGVADSAVYEARAAASTLPASPSVSAGAPMDGVQAWRGDTAPAAGGSTTAAEIAQIEQTPWHDMKGVAALNHFKVGSGQPSFYLFSDPRCAACSAFENILAQTKDVTYAVVPVGAQTQESAVLVAQVFCADDQPSAWRKVMGGDQAPPQGKSEAQVRACADKTLANLKYFLDNTPGGRAATPTLVRADGKIRIGAFPNPQGLKDWLAS